MAGHGINRARLLAGGLVVAGLVAGGLSIAWWWLTYRDAIGYDYLPTSSAGVCLIGETTICHLARSICRGAHPREVVDYWSPSIWLSAALLFSSLIVGANSAGRRVAR